MAIRLETLGTIRVIRDGQELGRLPSQPVRCALLVHLALEREVAREALLALLWPDRDDDHARRALNQTIYELRQLLGDDAIVVTGDRVQVSGEVTADAVEFRDLVETGEAETALGLYGGALLGGAPLASTRAFEGWVDGWQAKLARLHRRARREAIDARVEAGQGRAALDIARDWVERDPLDDDAQHRFIELLAASGDRSGALRQYERYESLVRRELELEPLDETKELVEAIRTGAVGERERRSEGGADEGGGGARAVREPAAAYAAQAGGVSAGPTSPGDAPSGARQSGRSAGAELTRGRLGTMLAELRRRRVVPWMLAYLAGGWVLIEAGDYFARTYGLPSSFVPGLTIALAFGALAVLVVAWFHGAAGWQQVTGTELALLAVIIVAGSTTTALTVAGSALVPSSAGAAAEGRPPLTRIAVLYFDDLTDDGDLQPLADRLTEFLIDRLAQFDVLEVSPRFAVARYRNADVQPDSIVAALGVGSVVEGSLARSGDQLRLTVQLIDARKKAHLLSTQLDWPTARRDEVLDHLPDRAARLVLRTLGDTIEQREIRAEASSEAAWRYLVQAQRIMDEEIDVWRENMDAGLRLLDQADSLLAEAERADPDWLRPLVRRANVARFRAQMLAPPAVSLDPTTARVALGHLQRALNRDPEYAPALEQRGMLRFRLAENASAESADTLYLRAEQDLRRAVRSDPSRAMAWYGLSQLLRRKLASVAARDAAERAYQADAFQRHSNELVFQLFFISYELEDYAAAERWCDEGRQRFPDFQNPYLCRLLLLSTNPNEAPDAPAAWAVADTLASLSAESSRWVWRDMGAIFTAKVLARAGQADSARAVLDRVTSGAGRPVSPYDVAHAYLMLGDRDETLRYLRSYIRDNPAKVPTLARDWYFGPLHGDPTFDALIGAPGNR